MKIKTSSFAVAAAVLLMIMLFAVPVGATVTWVGTGTQDDPYLVESADHLNDLRNKAIPSSGAKHYFKIKDDIDLSQSSYADGWRPIGLVNAQSVYIDGNGKTISNLNITHDPTLGYIGLFGYVNDGVFLQIKDLTIKNAYLDNSQTSAGDPATGVLVGFLGSWGSTESSSIINCDVTGIIQVNGKKFTGGLVGYANKVSVSNCDISSTDDNSFVTGSRVGGLIGMLAGNYPASIDEINSNLQVSGSDVSGGLIGRLGTSGENEITISSSVVTGDVNGNVAGALIGQIVGTNFDTFSVTSSSANGLVSGVDKVGLIGGFYSSEVDVEAFSEKVDATYIVPEDADSDYLSKIDTTYGGEISYPQTSTPSQPATSSSSSGTPTPGAYYNYPRTVSDGGLVEFGTSKVVKSVTLPAGSSGKVNLHIDSTAYWPLSLDSEFTFDISVDNLGEGTSYISFKIAESKLTALELTAADVGVYHNVNGEWVKLVVTYTIEDGDVIYTAETDSFSPFKLVIEEGAAVQKEEVTPSEPVVDEPVIPDVPQDVPGEVLPDIPDIQDEPETPSSPAPVLGLLAALGAAVVLRRK